MSKTADAVSLGAVEPTALGARLVHWALKIIEFGAVQVAVQLLGALAGLLIVRSLSKSEYALFAIANSMQTTCNLLADCGIGVGLRAIGGRVWNEPKSFGALLASALELRRSLALISFAVSLPLAGWMLWQNGATPWQLAGFSVALIAGVIPLLSSTVHALAPQLHGEFRRIQGLDLSTAVLRVLLIGALAASKITALLAVMIGVIGNWLQAIFYRRWAHQHADPEARPIPEQRRELIGYSLQWLPNLIFFCFQGQVTLLILSLFGSSSAIADLTALSRIAVLFTAMSAICTTLFAPRFARYQEHAALKALYGAIVGASSALLVALFTVVWLWPEPFLWLLGDSYRGLAAECVWVVGAGSIAQLGTVLWSLNSSKGWIRWQSIGYIPAILTVQVGAAFCLDLSQFHQVLLFNLLTAAAPLPMYLLDAWQGLRKHS
jgi:O-antigen/teichoic acid export membrane protein